MQNKNFNKADLMPSTLPNNFVQHQQLLDSYIDLNTKGDNALCNSSIIPIVFKEDHKLCLSSVREKADVQEDPSMLPSVAPYDHRHSSMLTQHSMSTEPIIEFIQGLLSHLVDCVIDKYNPSSQPFSKNRPFNSKELFRNTSVSCRTNSCYSPLTKLMAKTSATTPQYKRRSAFLPRTTEADPNYKKLKIYLFGTSQFTFLSISKENNIEQLIRHVVSLADVDPQIGKCFDYGLPATIKGSSREPELYEMRLLEDLESSAVPTPIYEHEALNRDSRVADWHANSLAFCKTRDFEKLIHDSKAGTCFQPTMEPEAKREVILELAPCRKVSSAKPLASFVANTWISKRYEEDLVFDSAGKP